MSDMGYSAHFWLLYGALNAEDSLHKIMPTLKMSEYDHSHNIEGGRSAICNECIHVGTLPQSVNGSHKYCSTSSDIQVTIYRFRNPDKFRSLGVSEDSRVAYCRRFLGVDRRSVIIKFIDLIGV